MVAPIKQTVTVQAGGVVQVQSAELHEGDQADVTVIVRQAAPANGATAGEWKRFAGAIKGGRQHGGDNEAIDADLAAEHVSAPRPEH